MVLLTTFTSVIVSPLSMFIIIIITSSRVCRPTIWLVVLLLLISPPPSPNNLFASCHRQLSSGGREQFTHDHRKTSPLLSAEHECLSQFTVRESSIIRTRDSRLQGAKFLNESDSVGNREDCLAFCCATVRCNVAVFQEKSPFSCYLFDCGPPDAFVCKFTSHTFYTSAVMPTSVNQMELGQWSKQRKHEEELTGLRTGAPPNQETSVVQLTRNQSGGGGGDQKTRQEDVGSSRVDDSSSSPPSPFGGRRCSDYQFECRSGECIAVYNACDGVPQCRDGSDEASALDCPAAADGETSSGLDDAKPRVGDAPTNYPGGASRDEWKSSSSRGGGGGQSRGDQNQPRFDEASGDAARGFTHGHRNQKTRMGNAEELPPVVNENPPQQQGSPYASSFDGAPFFRGPSGNPREQQQQQPQSPYGLPFLQNQPKLFRENGVGGGDPRSRIYSHSREILPNQSWSSRTNFQGPPPPPPYPNGQRTPQNAMNVGPVYGDSIQGGFYPSGYDQWGRSLLPPSTYFRDPSGGQADAAPPPIKFVYHTPQVNSFSPSTKEETSLNKNSFLTEGVAVGISSLPPSVVDHGPGGRHDGSTTTGRKGAPPPYAPSGDTLPTPEDPKATPLPEIPSSLVSTTPAGALVLSSSRGAPSDSGGEQGGNSAQGTPRTTPSVAEEEQQVAEDEAAVQRAQTRGAVVALSLGMLITVMMVILIGCRLKGLSRRGRRKRRGLRPPLDHDADYLVNGLYL